jgi:hypothetical protein
MFSVIVTYRQHKKDAVPKRVVGAVLHTSCYWLKSALIAVAIIYGPEKHQWIVIYGLLAWFIYLIGDAGLYLLSTTKEGSGDVA